MINYDVYALFGEIKEKQEKILALLADHLKGESQPKIYDLVQLEEILHVSKRTIASWLKQGILPHSRVGAKIWISEFQLQEFLATHNQDVPANDHVIYNNRRIGK